jgi:hypothetical protein
MRAVVNLQIGRTGTDSSESKDDIHLLRPHLTGLHVHDS